MGQILIAIVIREVTFDLKIFIAFRILLIDLISPLICNLQPGPRDAPLKCFIRRNRATQSYFLCIGVTDGMYGQSSMSTLRVRRKGSVPSLSLQDIKQKSHSWYLPGHICLNFSSGVLGNCRQID